MAWKGSTHVRTMNAKRKELVKKGKGLVYVPWAKVLKKSRVPAADRTTVAKAFKRAGLQVKYRANRHKPQRKKEHLVERYQIRNKIRKYPSTQTNQRNIKAKFQV